MSYPIEAASAAQRSADGPADDGGWTPVSGEKTIRSRPEVSRTIRLDAAPYAIRYGHGRVWVTTQRCGSHGC